MKNYTNLFKVEKPVLGSWVPYVYVISAMVVQNLYSKFHSEHGET